MTRKRSLTERNENGLFEVTSSKWPCIPTGFWASSTRANNDIHHVCTPPNVTAKTLSWYEVHFHPDKLRIYERKFTKCSLFASKLDAWSYGSIFNTMRAISVSYHDLHNARGFNAWFAKLAKAKQSQLIEIIETFSPENELLLCLMYAVQEAADKVKSERSKKAAEKAKATREMTQNGGNPGKWTFGDIVCTKNKPLKFKRTTGTLYKFYVGYVPGNKDKTQVGFYLELDETGHGIGTRYAPTQKRIAKICPNAVPFLPYISRHEMMFLLQEQAAIEAKRDDKATA